VSRSGGINGSENKFLLAKLRKEGADFKKKEGIGKLARGGPRHAG